MQRLRQNLFLKLVSLACSVGLFLYVRKAESTERDAIPVPLTILTDADVKAVEPTGTRIINVTVRGPAEVVRGIHASQITAQIDLRGKRASPAQTLPVEVELAPELRDRNIAVEAVPGSVKVRLDEVITRYMQVAPHVDAEPPPGQAIGLPEVHPATVTVIGLREIVDRVKQLRAVVTEIAGKGAVDVLARVSAIDEAGTELRDRLQIQPATVKMHIPLERKIWTKTGVYVDPKMGALPPGLVVHTLTVRPVKVDVTGTDRVLADLWVVHTDTVDLPPMEGRVERIVRVIPPSGIQHVDPAQVHVTVELYRGLSPAPHRPAASGTAALTPGEKR